MEVVLVVVVVVVVVVFIYSADTVFNVASLILLAAFTSSRTAVILYSMLH